MLNSINSGIDRMEEISKKITGVNIKLKHISKSTLKINALTNAAVGLSCLIVGVLTSYKPLGIFTGVAVASSAVMAVLSANIEE